MSERAGIPTGTWAVAGVATFAVAVGLTKVTEAIGAAAIPIWLGFFSAVGFGFWLVSPLGRRVAESRPRADTPPAIDEQAYAELDELRQRVGELEERLDFAERLLARPADVPAAPPAAGRE